MGEVLFSAHMIQHEVMMLVAAPLLVLGRPLTPYLCGHADDVEKRCGQRSQGTLDSDILAMAQPDP